MYRDYSVSTGRNTILTMTMSTITQHPRPVDHLLDLLVVVMMVSYVTIKLPALDLFIMLLAPSVAAAKKNKPKSNKRKGPPKGRPGGDDGDEVSKPRSPNFAPWEDFLLCKAWVSVSMDPSVGCGQKRNSFWSRIEEKFNLLYDAFEMDEDEDGVKAVGGRSASQLDNRFNKVIKVDIVVFNKYFKQIKTERPSGIPWILHKALSCERYLEIEGKAVSSQFGHVAQATNRGMTSKVIRQVVSDQSSHSL
jgi:hypothetical protein